MKKTQPGPESTQRNGLRGSCCEGSAILRTDHRTERGEKDAARPRGIQCPCWGELRDVKRPACNAVADRRMLNLRPSCVSYAAGVRRRPERRTCLQQVGALRPGCPRGRSERHSNRCECVLRGDRWESKAQSFRSTPLGGCSESKARSYATGPGFGGLESSRFLGRETLEKPDNDLSIAPHRSVGKGFGASPAKVFDPVQFSSEKLHFTSDKVW